MDGSQFLVSPLKDSSFGAVVTDVKLSEIDDETFQELYTQWLEYALLIFPDQHLTNAEQIIFAKRFGDLEFDLAPITNVDKDGNVHFDPTEDRVKSIKGNMGWHTDSTYMPIQAKGAVFTAHTVPSTGGETGWADTQAAYEALSDDMKRKIRALKAYHSLWYSQSKLGHKPKVGEGYGFHEMEPPLRPIVKIHPETQRTMLTIGRHAYGIPELGEKASEELLQELVDFTVQSPRGYHHTWQVGDAVVWDNRRLMHQGRPWDMKEPRIMYHARIAGSNDSEFAGHA